MYTDLKSCVERALKGISHVEFLSLLSPKPGLRLLHEWKAFRGRRNIIHL